MLTYVAGERPLIVLLFGFVANCVPFLFQRRWGPLCGDTGKTSLSIRKYNPVIWTKIYLCFYIHANMRISELVLLLCRSCFLVCVVVCSVKIRFVCWPPSVAISVSIRFLCQCI